MLQRFIPILYPLLATIAGLVLARLPLGPEEGWGGMLHMAGLTLAAIAGAMVILRLLDITLWHGWLVRDGRRAPPRLLTDLFAAFVMIAVLMGLAGSLYGVPVTGLVTTSGVLVAVIGFALRDMLASLFSGIALNIEHPFAIGDWVGLDTGEVGQVIEVSWLTTHLRTKDRIVVVVPNAELATRRFKNYGAKGYEFRSEFDITIDHAIPAERVTRVLYAAVRSVSGANATSRSPDLKIKELAERGVVWRIRFWIDDYSDLIEVTYAVQRAALQHLHQAGIALPYRQVDLFHKAMPQRNLDFEDNRHEFIGRVDLFKGLDDEELQALSDAATEQHFPQDAILTEEGDNTRSLYIVLEGYLDVTVSGESPDSERLLVNQLAAGAFFGEFSLLTGAPRSARVQTRADSILLEITSEALTPILQRCPRIADHLARVLTARQMMTKEARSRSGQERNALLEERQLLGKIRSLFGL